MATSKIVKHNLEARAIELIQRTGSASQTAKTLTLESGIKINRQNVYNYFRAHDEIIREIARKNTQLLVQFVQQEINVNQELLRVNQKAWKALEELESNPEFSPAQRAPLLSILQHQCEFVAKRLGEVSDAPQIAIINQRVEKFESSVIDILLEVGGEELKQRFFDVAKQQLRE